MSPVQGIALWTITAKVNDVLRRIAIVNLYTYRCVSSKIVTIDQTVDVNDEWMETTVRRILAAGNRSKKVIREGLFQATNGRSLYSDPQCKR